MNIIKANLPWAVALTPLDINNVKYIILHHIAANTATIEEIDRWHKENGWLGCGYNYYVRKDGSVYEGRGFNVGAQCLGYNETSIGIAAEGNYEIEDVMPQIQEDSIIQLIQWLKPQLPSFERVDNHSKFVPTDCPGSNFPFETIIKKSTENVQPEQPNPPYVTDLCGQKIQMQMFDDHLEVRMGDGPWKVIVFDNN